LPESAAVSRFAQYALLFVLSLHLGGITLVSLREVSWLIANGLTILPVRWQTPAQKLEDLSIAALAENIEPGNAYHQAVATYLNLAGIQGGYGFFAPNVSDSYRLVFEFQFPDGHVERDFPHVGSEETAVRLAGLLDEIARTQIDLLREAVIKLLAEEAWSSHPGAIGARVIFSSATVAPAGQTPDQSSEEILYTYELELSSRIR
jgi:hypothetical protein